MFMKWKLYYISITKWKLIFPSVKCIMVDKTGQYLICNTKPITSSLSSLIEYKIKIFCL